MGGPWHPTVHASTRQDNCRLMEGGEGPSITTCPTYTTYFTGIRAIHGLISRTAVRNFSLMQPSGCSTGPQSAPSL